MIKHLFEGLPLKRSLLYFVILLSAVTVTYSNHFQNSFHFDDSHTIQNNIFIQDIQNIPLFFKDGTTFSSLPQNQSYRPVVSTSLALDYWAGNGYDLFHFHLSSFILFLLQGILMFFLTFRILEISYRNGWNFYIAALGTAWYMLHPANAETVNYVIARSDLQSTFFLVLGFILYIFSPLCKRYHLYLIPVGIGALAKPTAVMFAPMLFFYIMLFEEKCSFYGILKKENFTRIIRALKAVIPSFIFCVFMYWLVDHFTPKTWQSGGASVFNYLISQPFVIFHYFGTFFFPFGLSADTDWQGLTSIWNIRFFIGMAFIVFMLAVAIIFSRDARLRPVSFGIIWFFLALVPSSSVIPFAEILNDHRIYFPYVGLMISVCWVIGLLLLKYKKLYTDARPYTMTILAAALLLLSGYAYGVHERNKVWKTEESLWEDVSKKSPKNGRGLMNYGLALMGRGDYANAEIYFTKAIGMWPYYYSLHINMGVLKNAKGDKVTAENYFKNAVQYGPNYPDTWFFYGNFLNNQSRYMESIPMFEKAIALAPAHDGARSSLMKAYAETGEWDKLKRLAEQTLQVIPGNQEALNYLEVSKTRKGQLEIFAEEAMKSPTPEKYLDLSLLYYQKGDWLKCIEACRNAIKLKSDYADAYSNMCASYNQLQQWDKAIEACSQALKISPDHKLANGNLNWAKKQKQ
ncbi:MAG TPA: tetratricopeptide repeat protein [Bacteroidia bacterium]|jgi:tetratricopeptide (TPR) repeat protein